MKTDKKEIVCCLLSYCLGGSGAAHALILEEQIRILCLLICYYLEIGWRSADQTRSANTSPMGRALNW